MFSTATVSSLNVNRVVASQPASHIHTNPLQCLLLWLVAQGDFKKHQNQEHYREDIKTGRPAGYSEIATFSHRIAAGVTSTAQSSFSSGPRKLQNTCQMTNRACRGATTVAGPNRRRCTPNSSRAVCSQEQCNSLTLYIEKQRIVVLLLNLGTDWLTCR